MKKKNRKAKSIRAYIDPIIFERNWSSYIWPEIAYTSSLMKNKKNMVEIIITRVKKVKKAK